MCVISVSPYSAGDGEVLLLLDKATHVGADVHRASRGVAPWFPRRILGPLGAFLTSRRVRHRHPNINILSHGFYTPSRAASYGKQLTRVDDVFGTGATIGPEAPLGTTKESQVEVLNFCATTEFVALRKHKYATLRELAAAVAAQYAVVAALFDAECLPDDAFACVASFWLGPRGYDAAPAPRPRLAMPSIELESSSSSTA